LLIAHSQSPEQQLQQQHTGSVTNKQLLQFIVSKQWDEEDKQLDILRRALALQLVGGLHQWLKHCDHACC
jgi:hypothetical protein